MAELKAPEGALRPRHGGELQESSGHTRCFSAAVADGWRAGRGPHGGYLAAMMLRTLEASVEDPARTPRSLTIHFVRAPATGPVTITTVLEREGRSVSTLSARLEQDGRLMALALVPSRCRGAVLRSQRCRCRRSPRPRTRASPGR